MSGETFGQALRRWRKLRGHSLRGLGALMNYSHVYIWEVEQDRKQPLANFTAACDRYLDTGGQLIAIATSRRETSSAEEVTDGGRLEFPTDWVEGVGTVTSLWRHDAHRRKFLRNITFASTGLLAPIQNWLEDPDESAPVERVSEPPTTDSVRAMTRTFRRLDNLYGAGQIQVALVQYLDADVAPTLCGGTPDSLGRSFLSAVAEVTQLAGWLAYDSCDHGTGQRYFLQALHLAKAAQDRALGAEILAAMSHQAIFLRKPQPALDYANASYQAAIRERLPALAAEALIMQAHALALQRKTPECVRMLHEAETILASAERDNDPHWISYLDEAYLAAIAGHSFRLLGQPRQAERFARRSLDMTPGYVRGRLFNTVLLAQACILCKDIEQACAVGHQALDLASTVSSARAATQISSLLGDLAPWRSEPTVKNLIERAALVSP